VEYYDHSELERTSAEMAVAWFEVMCRHSPGVLRKTSQSASLKLETS